jgi:phosphoribosyl-AMP cyclohydrolase / phosphoribosyl-ATP pyrophosphohydrolase
MIDIDWQKNEGLVPAIVQEFGTGTVLMLGYMTQESLALTQSGGKVCFYSRSRKKLWIKGESSGHFLLFKSLSLDCDGDTVLIQAVPLGPTCHKGTKSCFEPSQNSSLDFLNQLTEVIDDRFSKPKSKNSYVGQLISEGLDRVIQKVGEEAIETVIAAKNSDLNDFENEASDLLFHLMVLLRAKGSSLAALTKILASR